MATKGRAKGTRRRSPRRRLFAAKSANYGTGGQDQSTHVGLLGGEGHPKDPEPQRLQEL